jgi:arylsulfatase A-like enzyme
MRRPPWLAAALGLFVFTGAVAAPAVYLGATTPRAAPRVARTPAPPGAPDVVLVVLDTVRADHVSAYGYGRPTTPNFDALAAGGALFLDATAPATWSLPSHASLFTGRFVSAHGAHDEHKFLDPGPPTLAEVLAAAGWDTRCFTANAWISDGLGLTRGFAWQDGAWREANIAHGFQFVYRLLDRLGWHTTDKGGSDAARHFEDWLAARPAGDPPAFTFLNFIEAHFPYHMLPDDYLGRFSPLPRDALRRLSLRLMVAQFGAEAVDPAEAAAPATAMYDAGILYADHLLGRVVEALRRRGTLDRTILVVLADHGELLGEHGEFGHGHSLYQVGLRVPLLVRYPPRVAPGTRVATPVSTVGVYATVLELAGLRAPAPVDVGSLLPALAGRPAGWPIISEQYEAMLGSAPGGGPEDPLMRRDRRYRALREDEWKLVEASDGSSWLFDLADDPLETRDRSRDEPQRAASLRLVLRSLAANLHLPALDGSVSRPPMAAAVDPAARQRLRALGYVE